MAKDKDIRTEFTEKYGIVDEGDIVELTDLEMREEIFPGIRTEMRKAEVG